jgi:rhodanese-related sulfurtransferase
MSDAGGIDRLLEDERRLLDRLTPEQAREAAARGGLIIDTRSHEQRRAGGTVPGAVRIHRNVLEWRVDPRSGHQDPRIAAATGPLVIMCEQGYSSSLAAATLKRLGIEQATDMAGGFEAWLAAGLPVEPAAD